MNYQSPQNGPGSSYHSPSQHTSQTHQDSGVSFSTPSQDQAALYTSPQENGMLYQDSKMYSSPGQMHHFPDESQLFQDGAENGFDMQTQQIFGFVDPNNLGQQQ